MVGAVSTPGLKTEPIWIRLAARLEKSGEIIRTERMVYRPEKAKDFDLEPNPNGRATNSAFTGESSRRGS